MVLYLYSSFYLFSPHFVLLFSLLSLFFFFSTFFSYFFITLLITMRHPQEGRPIQQTSALDLLLSGVKGKVLCKGRLAVIRNFILSTVQFLPIIMMIILFKIIVLLMQNCICEEKMTNIRYRMYI